LVVYLKPYETVPANLSTNESQETERSFKFKRSTPPIKILQTKDDMKIRKELLCLRKFLNLDLDKPLKVVDQTVDAYYERKGKEEKKKRAQEMREFKKDIAVTGETKKDD